MSNAIANAAAAIVAGAALLSAGVAQAQSSYPQGSSSSYQGPGGPGYNYDPCRRDANQRGTAGALIGGGMGAVIGSNAAARNARTEGALLGGLLGAIAGGVIGNKTAACTSQYDRNASLPPPPLPPRADAPYYERDAYADRAAADARDDASWRDRPLPPPEPERRVTDRSRDLEDCTLAESPIYMPDGRTQTRFVRVCRDASGKYAVVD